MNQKSYESTHLILGAIELFAWLAVVSCVILGFLSIGNEDAYVGAVPLFSMAASSLGLAAICRVGRAILDIADNTGRSAALLHDRTNTKSFSAEPRHPDAPLRDEVSERGWPIGQVEIYRGHVITGLPNRVFTNDQYFDSLEQARTHLDSVPAKNR